MLIFGAHINGSLGKIHSMVETMAELSGCTVQTPYPRTLEYPEAVLLDYIVFLILH